MAKRGNVNVLPDETDALAESVSFMAGKIREANEALQHEDFVIEYNNGGGQSGTRINPHFTAYEKLVATYNRSLKQLMEILKEHPEKRENSSVIKDLNEFASRRLG